MNNNPQTTPDEQPADDSWRPKWHRQFWTLGGTGIPVLNDHLSQLRPYTGKRPEALNRAVEMARERERNRFVSGSSLIAGGVRRDRRP